MTSFDSVDAQNTPENTVPEIIVSQNTVAETPAAETQPEGL